MNSKGFALNGRNPQDVDKVVSGFASLCKMIGRNFAFL